MKRSPDISTSRANFAGIHYTVKHTGKMSGLVSLSTDINSNPLCLARQKNGAAVCSACFASRMFDDNAGRYRGVNRAFKVNTEILTTRLLSDNEIPVIDPVRFPLFRFEAYGDLMNITQALNYIKIARKNPYVNFALWSKNPAFAVSAFRIAGKPCNLSFILSSLKLNTPAAGAENVPFLDRVFTVYDHTPAAGINCGARSCFSCRRCYMPRPAGAPVEYVREMIK